MPGFEGGKQLMTKVPAATAILQIRVSAGRSCARDWEK